jgi:hypothetical protein
MGESIIPTENSEKRPVDWADDDDMSIEFKPIVLTGQDAIDFADMLLSQPPAPSPALKRALERRHKMVITERATP